MSKAKLRAKGACKNYKICIIYGFKFEFFKAKFSVPLFYIK